MCTRYPNAYPSGLQMHQKLRKRNWGKHAKYHIDSRIVSNFRSAIKVQLIEKVINSAFVFVVNKSKDKLFQNEVELSGTRRARVGTSRYFLAFTAQREQPCQNDKNISPSFKPYGFYENSRTIKTTCPIKTRSWFNFFTFKKSF